MHNTRTRFKVCFWACPSLRSGRAAPGFVGSVSPRRARRDRPFGAPSASLTQAAASAAGAGRRPNPFTLSHFLPQNDIRQKPPSQTLPPHEGEGLGLGVKIVYNSVWYNPVVLTEF